jgi:hypothetical protein
MTAISRAARYRQRATECWARAQEEDDPTLLDLWTCLAAHYQELASQCEHYEAQQRARTEPPDAPLERRYHAAAARGKARFAGKQRG